MANLFDTSAAKEGEPTEVVVGDYLQWKRSDIFSDYPPAEYSTEYVARVTGGGETEIKLAGTPGTAEYLFIVSSSVSADFLPGDYHWQLEVTKTATGDRVVVDTGVFTAIPDLDVNQADPRIHAEIMLGKIESILEGRADSDVASYSIGTRSLTKLSITELMEWRDYYRREITANKNRELVKRGKSNGSTIKVTF